MPGARSFGMAEAAAPLLSAVPSSASGTTNCALPAWSGNAS